MDYRMQELLDLLKSNRLTDRKKGIDGLRDWNYQLEMEDATKLLELAGQIWPISEEEWDDPSLALVQAACVFIHEDMIPIIERNLLNYSFHAINRALSYLIILHSPEAITLYKKIFSRYCLYARLIPAYDERNLMFEKKERTMTAIGALVENDVHFYPLYEWYYHFLIKMGIENQYFTRADVILDKEIIIERLQYQFDQYATYDKEYNWKFVYEAWKVPYFQMRFYITNYLTIFSELSSDEELMQLNFILDWKDPELKLLYIELLWKRNLEVDHNIVLQLLTSDEVSRDAYWLLKKYKPELLPTDPSYQKYFVMEAANFVFYNNKAGIGKFPDEVEIMGTFEEKDHIYDLSLTYYVVRFRSEDPAFANKGWMRMLIGAYKTSSIPINISPSGLGDYYTDLISWEEKPYEGHVDDFRAHLAEKHGKNEVEEVFYYSTPKFKKVNNTIALLAFLVSFALIWVNDWFVLGFVLVPLWLLLTYFHAKKLEKNIIVQVRGYHLDYYCFENRTYVLLGSIAEVKLEKRTIAKPERFLFIPLKKWHFNFYDYEGNVIYSIPRNYLQEEYFFPIFNNQTAHLAQPPVLEWEKEQQISLNDQSFNNQ